jgi:hypothetical protein
MKFEDFDTTTTVKTILFNWFLIFFNFKRLFAYAVAAVF